MRSNLRLFPAAIALLAFGALAAHAELTVEGYVALTLERLTLVESFWRETGGPPTEQELDELYEEHGTDRESYFEFGGEHRERIEEHLDENPEQREAIDELSAAIRSAVRGGEEP